MHRRIARFLLLITLLGYLNPLARAVTAAPHACCIRKAIHHCHDSLGSETEQLVIRDAACCGNGNGHSVITARWAHAERPANHIFATVIEDYLTPDDPILPKTKGSRFNPTRAPPHSSIA